MEETWESTQPCRPGEPLPYKVVGSTRQEQELEEWARWQEPTLQLGSCFAQEWCHRGPGARPSMDWHRPSEPAGPGPRSCLWDFGPTVCARWQSSLSWEEQGPSRPQRLQWMWWATGFVGCDRCLPWPTRQLVLGRQFAVNWSTPGITGEVCVGLCLA